MATQLTTPQVQSATTATLDAFEINLLRRADFSVDVPNSHLLARVVFREANGNAVRIVNVDKQGSELTAAVRTAARDLQNALVTYLRAQGVLPAGTDTSDL